MIKEFSEFGKSLRSQKTENNWVNDALQEVDISLVLTIKHDGSFVSLRSIEKKKTIAEAVQRTSGKGARLLIDNCGYVLGVYDYDGNDFKKKAKKMGEQKAHDILKKDTSEKLELFKDRLNEFVDLDEIKPLFKFYDSNKQSGIDTVTQDYFMKNILKKDRGGNIALLVSNTDKYVHEHDVVYQRIVDVYTLKQKDFISKIKRKCSICGGWQYPVGDFTHFPIKGIPGSKEPAGGRKLVSYNGDNNPFESYGMVGNENSMICTNCSKTYVEGLNWLLSEGTIFKNKKNKDDIRYTNRWPLTRSASFRMDTVMVFWTRENKKLDVADFLERPKSEEVAKFIDSVTSAKESDSRYLEHDRFYSCTLSGSAARVVVRDWIETSLVDFKESIAKWFQDIAIVEYDNDLKNTQINYAGLYDLARCCQRKNTDGTYDKEDKSLSRVAANLWNAALKNVKPPLWILTKVLQRARINGKPQNESKVQKHIDGVTAERAALIKLILNRQNEGGNFVITEKIVEGNRPAAYVCGQIFAKLESIQYFALGEKNAGIREKFFTFAMTSPSSAFGRLFNLNSKHFTKLKNDKPGLAVNMDCELQLLCKDVDINCFPATFSLIEQGQFAIGYYHQRQLQFNCSKENKKER
ncbi:MAG: type I-C CRISPR-associated protein Cas8c/Csd1 [Nitrospirae bacterium YQR-1]